MKKITSIALILCLCMGMLAGMVGVALAATDNTVVFSNQWEYGITAEGASYYKLDAVYCTNPVDADQQHLVIYAPAAYMTQNEDGTVSLNPEGQVVSSNGVVYTAETAPIVYHNTSSGYGASQIAAADAGYLQEGYIHVSVATRGKDSRDSAGEYIGAFPAIIVDLKAGIRFLKFFDDVLPGDSSRIISRGYSSGGAVTAMLGASGNSPIFDEYLAEIGAYDAPDDIFAAAASAPITNLSSADAFYEWFQAGNTSYSLFGNMAYDREGNDISDILSSGRGGSYTLGDNVLGGAHEDELSALLYDWFVVYVQDLGFDLGNDGRSGEFYDGFVQLYADALTEYVARFEELNTDQRYETAQMYLEDLGEGNWFTYDEATGVVTIESLDAFTAAYLDRNKMCPSLDAYNYKSNENSAFLDENGSPVHFSGVVRDMLQILLEDESYEWTEEERAYIQALYEDYDNDITPEAMEMLEIMSPINYIVGAGGFEDADIAPYWRLRTGSADGDHGAPAAWLLAQGLEKYTDAEVSIGIAWGMGHSLSELTQQDLYDYIDEIMTESGL